VRTNCKRTSDVSGEEHAFGSEQQCAGSGHTVGNRPRSDSNGEAHAYEICKRFCSAVMCGCRTNAVGHALVMCHESSKSTR
jgi:hypothetical protein